MAGEVPESADITHLFPDEPGLLDGDDATTNYTREGPPELPKLKSISLEPIYAPPVESPKTKNVTATIDEAPERPKQKFVQIEEVPPEPEPPSKIYEMVDVLPDKKPKEPSLPRKKEVRLENMFIYKDFETSLTKVKSPVTKLPMLAQTTQKRPEDLIRDRLLSFNIRNNVANRFDPDPNRPRSRSINERSQSLKKWRQGEN